MSKKDRNRRAGLNASALSACQLQLQRLIRSGLDLQRVGNLLQAEQAFLQALQLDRENPDALYHLGNLRWQQGNLEAAAECYRKAVKANPSFVHAYLNLGASSWVLGRYDEAINCYRKVIQLNPDEVNGLLNLAGAYSEQGKTGLAKKYYRKVLDMGGYDGVRIRLASMLPMILDSSRQIRELREHLDAGWTGLLSSGLHVRNPLQEIGSTNFLIAYHGCDDRNLQVKFAALCKDACPSLNYVARHCRETYRKQPGKKIKIGFISAFFKNHSIGNTSRGLIKHLPRDHLEIVAIFLNPPADKVGEFIRQNADHSVVLPADLDAARRCIEGLELDILFYQDTGMDTFTYFLAYSRLAPIQCTSFGHPETTGVQTLDYYISTDAWEPEGADEHYSETLVRLNDVASVAYYYKPSLPEQLKTRSDFGLSDESHIYICPQTLFKFHPDFDDAMAAILGVDPDGEIILVQGKHSHWEEMLKSRFSRTIPDAKERIRFLPQMPELDFNNLIAVSDVMLDTFHFCGFNTTLQAFVSGVPVVTLPGKFMRGRHTLSFYRKMGIDDCIADDVGEYASIAVRLGTDADFRETTSRRILEKSPVLWEEAGVLREFERVFLEMVDNQCARGAGS